MALEPAQRLSANTPDLIRYASPAWPNAGSYVLVRINAMMVFIPELHKCGPLQKLNSRP